MKIINQKGKSCGKLEWLPTWEGVLMYDPEDLKNDRPIRLWHVVKHKRFGNKKVCYEVKPTLRRFRHSRNSQRPRARLAFNHHGKMIGLYRSHVTMLALVGFTISDHRHWVIDHVNGCTLDDRPSNLQVISQKENCRRSERYRESRPLSPKEQKRRAIIRQAWMAERRLALMNAMPYADEIDIELELTMQMREHVFDYGLTPDPGLTPNPSPKGEGNFKGEGSRNS